MTANTQFDESIEGQQIELVVKERRYRNQPPETVMGGTGEYVRYPDGYDWDVDKSVCVVSEIETRTTETPLGDYTRQVAILEDIETGERVPWVAHDLAEALDDGWEFEDETTVSVTEARLLD